MELRYHESLSGFPNHISNSLISFDDQLVCMDDGNPASIIQFSLSSNKVVKKFPSGHAKKIDTLCFGNISKTLATACRSQVNVCNIIKESHVCVGKDLGTVSHMSFSPNDVLLSICIEKEIWVIDTMLSELVANFTEQKDIVAAEFCNKPSFVLLSISNQGMYSVWDIKEKCLLFQSTIICVKGLTSLSVHPYEYQFSVSSSEGFLHVFNGCTNKLVHKQHLDTALKREEHKEAIEMHSICVIAMKYIYKKPSQNHHTVLRSLEEELYLVVCTFCSIVVFNANSMEVLTNLIFADMECLGSVNCSTISMDDHSINVFVIGNFSREIHVFKAVSCDAETANQLSVLSQDPILTSSALRATFQLKCNSVKKNDKKKVDRMNQPVIFHSNVKSAGYLKQEYPKSKPSANRKVKTNAQVAGVKAGPWNTVVNTRSVKSYPFEDNPPLTPHLNRQLIEKGSGTINDLTFSGSGRSLVCALSDTTAVLLKFPGAERTKPFLGHQTTVNSVSMNHGSNAVLTSSSDRTVKMWRPKVAECLLNISTYKGNTSKYADKENYLFNKDINDAIFYFNDTFVLLSHGNSLCMYKYHIDETKSDLKRYELKSRYKLVHDFTVCQAHSLTGFSAINSFYSYFVLCAYTNRDVIIYDMNRHEISRTIKDAHSRPVHSIKQNQGSFVDAQHNQVYDLFVTSSTADGIKLWDLRSSRCVRKYEEHVNRAHKVGLAFSPCSRFIAVGSEDKSVYIYDVRSSTKLHRLPCQDDVISAVTFNPVHPILACGSMNGTLRTYNTS